MKIKEEKLFEIINNVCTYLYGEEYEVKKNLGTNKIELTIHYPELIISNTEGYTHKIIELVDKLVQ